MKKKFAIEISQPNRQEVLPEEKLGRPDDTVVRFPKNTSNTRTADFAPFYGQGFDEITSAFQRSIEKLVGESVRTGGKTLAVSTIINYWNSGAKAFFSYLSLMRAVTGSDLEMTDLNAHMISQYVHHLKNEAIGYTTQKDYYTDTKALLIACYRYGFWPQVDIKIIFPSNPFPNSNSRLQGQKSLTKKERRQVIRALRIEVARIAEGSELLSSYDLTVCVFAIALSTGMNPTPILELLTDCVQPHPLKANLRLLVSYKRRGNATQVVALRKSEKVSELASLQLHAADAIDLIIARNAELRSKYTDPARLFVYRSKRVNAGKVVALTAATLYDRSLQFAKKHKLTTDDGRPMSLSVSRLRKTFLNRIWELSGQDPLMSARTGRHTQETGNAHYWEAPPEAEANMRFIGEARVEELRNKKKLIASDRTPVGSCRDSKHGQRAPKNGDVCTEVLGCFRCKSFVVTADDLHRLFSFYWAVVRNHENFGGKRWKKYLRQVIRLIDEEIAPQFDARVVSEHRDKARKEPHPFWRDLTMARMTI